MVTHTAEDGDLNNRSLGVCQCAYKVTRGNQLPAPAPTHTNSQNPREQEIRVGAGLAMTLSSWTFQCQFLLSRTIRA